MINFRSLIVLLFIFSQSTYAGDLLEKLKDAAGDALEETVDEKLEEGLDNLSGDYKGKITELVLIERRGNTVTFDVKFEGIKKSDGVSIEREVLYGGDVLDGFVNESVAVNEKSGTMRLSVKYRPGESDGDDWGSDSSYDEEQVYSDQIRLALIRDENPERQFGTLVFNMSKEWTTSSDPDQPPQEESSDDEIKLENEGKGESRPPKGIFIKPGSTLKPLVVAPESKVNGAKPLPVKPIAVINVNGSYDLYKNATKAKWINGKRQPVAINPKKNSKSGFIRTMPKGKLSTGNAAINLLNAYPEMRKNGVITGEMPVMVLGKNIHFKSIIGFLHGAKSKDGVGFYVFVKEDGRKRLRKVYGKKIKPNKYENVDINLSRFAGKKIQIILRVTAGRSYVHDFAVWVAPKLVKG